MKPPLMEELFIVFVRTLLLYTLALVVFRAMGKRTVGKMGPFDFALIIIIGEAVALGMEAQNRLLPAILPIVLLGALQVAITHLGRRWSWFDRLTQGSPVALVKEGRVQSQNLRAERVPDADLTMELHQQGVDRIEDVKLAELEPTGKVAVIMTEAASPLTRADIPQLARAVADLLTEREAIR
jgi:uncharacterized membrane protein YcaP (DUF421 family)